MSSIRQNRLGTFDLSMHSWREPFDRIVALGDVQGIPVITPLMGEPASMHDTTGGRRWWKFQERYKETEQVHVKRLSSGAGGDS